MQFFLRLAAVTVACAAAAPATSMGQSDCALSRADRAWLDRSMAAWELTSREITGIGQGQRIDALFFDGSCVLASSSAMNGGPAKWTARPHGGQVAIPGGPTLPVGVNSFALGGDGRNLFVMSTPSVWRAADVKDNGLGSLETLMTAVVLHEGTHVAQVPTYGRRMDALSRAHGLADDFNDDSIQKRFRGNAEFSGSVKREIDLLLSAAEAADDEEALRLAREAMSLIRQRQARWFTGADAYLAEAEDIWLSMEGSAQWAAYQWVVHPRGGSVSVPAAFHSFGRLDRWWSQDLGFALFMALDRLAGTGWKRHAFGDGARTGLEMLEEAIASPSAAGAPAS